MRSALLEGRLPELHDHPAAAVFATPGLLIADLSKPPATAFYESIPSPILGERSDLCLALINCKAWRQWAGCWLSFLPFWPLPMHKYVFHARHKDRKGRKIKISQEKGPFLGVGEGRGHVAKVLTPARGFH